MGTTTPTQSSKFYSSTSSKLNHSKLQRHKSQYLLLLTQPWVAFLFYLFLFLLDPSALRYRRRPQTESGKEEEEDAGERERDPPPHFLAAQRERRGRGGRETEPTKLSLSLTSWEEGHTSCLPVGTRLQQQRRGGGGSPQCFFGRKEKAEEMEELPLFGREV